MAGASHAGVSVSNTFLFFFMFLFDLSAFLFAWVGGYFLRFNFDVPEALLPALKWGGLLLAPLHVLACRVAGLYHGIWLVSSLPDFKQVLRATALSTAGVGAFLMLFRFSGQLVPSSLLVIYPMLLALYMGSGRAVFRMWTDRRFFGELMAEGRQALIVGADRFLHGRWLAPVAFSILTGIYLLSFGAFNTVFGRWHYEWNSVVLAVTAVTLALFWWRQKQVARCDSSGSVLSVFALLLMVGILASGLAHALALRMQPDSQPVNLSGVLVAHWRGENSAFTVRYLFFPLILLVMVRIVRELSLTTVIRVVSVIFLFSVAVLYYQRFADATFMSRYRWGTNPHMGLATDPNAYQMSALLAVPFLLVGGFVDKRIAWKGIHTFGACLAAWGLIWSAGRTATVGFGLLLALVPVIVGIVRSDFSHRVWLLLVACSVVIFNVELLLLRYFADAIAVSSILGTRFLETWTQFVQGGFEGLFAKGVEAQGRGILLTIAWPLLLAAPLGGWGPGGYYREFSNQYFVESREIRPAFDSVTNHYLMVPIDFGLPILLIYLVLMFVPLVVGVLALRRLHTMRSRSVVVTLLATQLVFLLGINTIPPAYFPDLIWLWTLQLGLLLVIGERVGVSIEGMLPHGRQRTVALGFACGLVAVSAIGAYPVTFGDRGYQARLDFEGSPLRYERNCYGIEQDDHNRWQWCGRNARLKLPLPVEGHDELALSLSASNPDLLNTPLTVRYGGFKGPIRELVLSNRQPVQIHVPLDASNLVVMQRPDGKGNERFVVLSLDVSRTWVPKQWGVSEDPRELGVSVRLPK
jgi:hypothetical protein